MGIITKLSRDCPKTRALRLGHPHHLEGTPLDCDHLAERIGVGEELVFEVVADEGHRQAPAVLDVSEEAARSGLGIGDDPDVGADAGQTAVLDQSPCRR